MPDLHDRIAAIQAALQEGQEVEYADPPPRSSLDHRFDRYASDFDARPVPSPSQERRNPLDAVSQVPPKPQFYDSIAATFGAGILDEEDTVDYVVYNAFVTNLRVCPVHLTDAGHFYYVEHRSFLPHVPGVILRQGSDKDGKSIGVAHLPLKGHNRFGVGDLQNRPNDVVWEDMVHKGFWTHMRYEFEHELPNGTLKSFDWIRTRNNVLDDQGDLVLVEKGREDQILVEYMGKGLMKWKKRGQLRIRTMEGFGDSWESVVLLTWASVIELSRRRARLRRYSPTHLIGI